MTHPLQLVTSRLQILTTKQVTRGTRTERGLHLQTLRVSKLFAGSSNGSWLLEADRAGIERVGEFVGLVESFRTFFLCTFFVGTETFNKERFRWKGRVDSPLQRREEGISLSSSTCLDSSLVLFKRVEIFAIRPRTGSTDRQLLISRFLSPTALKNLTSTILGRGLLSGGTKTRAQKT